MHLTAKILPFDSIKHKTIKFRSEELLMTKIIQVVVYKSVSDEEKLEKYAALAGPAMMAAGGRILARGMPVAVKEAGEATRTVVIEWTSLEAAEKGYASDGYQAALAALDGGAIREFRHVEAV
ncbi:MAG: DUF1330 domain-containing protein [Alphaproteobacteria bacterium]